MNRKIVLNPSLNSIVFLKGIHIFTLLRCFGHCTRLKFVYTFYSKTDFYLIEEDGGSGLFYFVKKAHELIKAGRIDLSHWKDAVAVILKQMAECIEFLHSHNIAHFDISLENFVINDVSIVVDTKYENGTKTEKIRFVLDNIQIKLIDFGMFLYFLASDCLFPFVFLHRISSNV